MGGSKLKKAFRKVWHFIWEDNSIWSWIVNIILAFVLIKFIVYPLLGFVLGTNFPIVAVVSSSMEHRSIPNCIQTTQAESFGFDVEKCVSYNYVLCSESFDKKKSFDIDEYWDVCGPWYISYTNITKEDFKNFKFSNGFNKGDIMILSGAKPENIKVGEVIVFRSSQTQLTDPIIHRVVNTGENDGIWYAVTKGDHNPRSDNGYVTEDKIVGKAMVRIPLLGYIKIWFVELVKLVILFIRGL